MAKNTIKVKNYSDVVEEYVANAAITPGNLLELMSTGKVRRHATATGNVLVMFALENELEGEDIDTNYAADDQVQVWIPGRGDQVYALLEDGENVVVGDYLASNGAGRLQKHVEESTGIQPLQIVAQALEALDLSGSSGEETTNRIIVRIV